MPFGDAARHQLRKARHAMKVARYPAFLLGIMAVFFGGICVLWLSGRSELYFSVMHFLCVDAWTRPFLDMTGVLSMGECHRLGVDVMKNNPCDPLGRLLNYGPPLVHLPFSTADANLLGMLQGLALLIAAAFVLRPRTRGELAIAAVASLSCGVLYALERANLDALEFVLIVLSGPLSARGRGGRFVSYALYYVGGVLKFYPFALLLMILRERLALAIGLGVACLAAIGSYALIYRHDLSAIGAALPPFEYNADVFGATCLPFGLADWLELPDFAGIALMTVLVAGFGVVAWRIARRIRGELARAGFDGLNLHYLLAGSIVLIGCFFIHTNITYRTVFLLLLLPGFFDLRRTASLRRMFGAAIAAAIFCLWSEFFRQWGDYAIDAVQDLIAPERPDTPLWNAPSMVFFVGRELVWWWLIAVMGAIVGVFALDSPAVQGLRRLVRPVPNAPTPRAGTS